MCINRDILADYDPVSDVYVCGRVNTDPSAYVAAAAETGAASTAMSINELDLTDLIASV